MKHKETSKRHNRSPNKVLKHIELLTVSNEDIISAPLTNQISTVSDEQTASNLHYLRICASLLSQTSQRFQTVCFVLSAMEDQMSKSSDELVVVLKFVLMASVVFSTILQHWLAKTVSTNDRMPWSRERVFLYVVVIAVTSPFGGWLRRKSLQQCTNSNMYTAHPITIGKVTWSHSALCEVIYQNTLDVGLQFAAKNVSLHVRVKRWMKWGWTICFFLPYQNAK